MEWTVMHCYKNHGRVLDAHRGVASGHNTLHLHQDSEAHHNYWFSAFPLFVTNVMPPYKSYIVLDPCAQLDSLVSIISLDRFRISIYQHKMVDLLMGMGNGDSRLNFVVTKSLQSANKVLWSGVPGLFEESVLFLENPADRIPLRLFLLT